MNVTGRVLKLIEEKKKIQLNTLLLHPTSGFNRLEFAGYIKITNIDGVFFATLSDKGRKDLLDAKDNPEHFLNRINV